MHKEVPLETDDLNGEPPFKDVVYKGIPWDLAHLKPYSFVTQLVGYDLPIRVVVIFSCHCFTREETSLEQLTGTLMPHDKYDDGRECRVLDENRYLLSKKYLPNIVKELSIRKITVADEARRNGNFVTLELHESVGIEGWYSVFFEVERERKRKLKLRVQSAYVREKLTNRDKDKKAVKLPTILKATLEGRKIKS